eukprot:1188133-Prorocentrum_minimum.AAC.7
MHSTPQRPYSILRRLHVETTPRRELQRVDKTSEVIAWFENRCDQTFRNARVLVTVSGQAPPTRRARNILAADQSDARSAGIFSRRTNQTQEPRVFSHDGPIRRKKCGYILATDQSDARSAGIFPRRTNRHRVSKSGPPVRRGGFQDTRGSRYERGLLKKQPVDRPRYRMCTPTKRL